MSKDWSKLETRLVVQSGEFPEIIVEFAELPQVGDAVAIKDFGVFEVLRRGFAPHFADQPPRFLILSEIEGRVAPPTGQYDFLYDK